MSHGRDAALLWAILEGQSQEQEGTGEKKRVLVTAPLVAEGRSEPYHRA